MDVSIIIVNFKNAKLTLDAINAINEKSSGFSYEIIVVDNSNDIIEFNKLKELCGDKAICVNANANLGFGKGNNLGVTMSNGKYVYFLNNDTLLINNAIYELYKFLENNKNVGIVGSNLYDCNEKPYHSFCKNELNLKNIKKNNSYISIIKRKLFRRQDFNYSSKPLKIAGNVCGASLMMLRSNFDKLGGFDKDIFMYAEETLLCYRLIHELNLEIYNIPSSKIIHLEGGSFGSELKMSSWRAKVFIDGTTVYFNKIYGRSECINYLRFTIKESKRKKIFSRLFKRNKQDFVNIIKACEDKINELND